MFLGEYIHTIDDKGRLVVPAKFRNALAGGMVITKGVDRCLVIYSMDAWQAYRERISALPTLDRDARDLRRLVFAGAVDVVPDTQGRFVIPQSLREYAGLDGQVVIAGCDTYIELWNPEEWAKVQARMTQNEENAGRWANLGV
ncbi:MAG: division/cell wall cluster transcriptional repressor MraZ [Thermoflexales bacterium]|nr:division/cell wall cluster transcriptional repressor MraZ [Thermoflexales bacterium]